MFQLFSHAVLFNDDIEEWDVSRVTDMTVMFLGAKSFDSDISEWDVSRVAVMYGMFSLAASFNRDISKWDVSHVTNMGTMFRGATSFKRKLCGAAWVNSKASKPLMFEDSFGSISETVCTRRTFLTQSKEELRMAVRACLEADPVGDCSSGLYGPIGKWNVSRINTMFNLFSDAKSFNTDISKWDVSRVSDMAAMFMGAESL